MPDHRLHRRLHGDVSGILRLRSGGPLGGDPRHDARRVRGHVDCHGACADLRRLARSTAVRFFAVAPSRSPSSSPLIGSRKKGSLVRSVRDGLLLGHSAISTTGFTTSTWTTTDPVRSDACSSCCSGSEPPPGPPGADSVPAASVPSSRGPASAPHWRSTTERYRGSSRRSTRRRGGARPDRRLLRAVPPGRRGRRLRTGSRRRRHARQRLRRVSAFSTMGPAFGNSRRRSRTARPSGWSRSDWPWWAGAASSRSRSPGAWPSHHPTSAGGGADERPPCRRPARSRRSSESPTPRST